MIGNGIDTARTINIPAILISALVIAGTAALRAQEHPGKRPGPDQAGRIKESPSSFIWGADLRLRNDSAGNPYLTAADPPGHSCSFERLRVREWNAFRPCDGCELNLRLAWEGRHYWRPDSKDEWDRSEIVFDNLNGKFRFGKVPAALTVGRQDIVFGDGWLVSDGTPLDGPRTAYFDAVRAVIELGENESALDLIYIAQKADPDSRLPPVFGQGNPLMEQDERGAIVNYSNAFMDGTRIEPYFIYKHDEPVLSSGDNGDIYTAGGRFARDFKGNISVRAEGAYQFGSRRNAAMFPGRDGALSAWGLKSRLTYDLRDRRKGQVWLGCEVLSGNGAGGAHAHQFDPLWGRWAQYSELFPNDRDRPGDRSNLLRANIGYQAEPAGGLQLQANYHAIFAYANRYSGTAGFSSGGKFKGHLFTAPLKYQYNSRWSGLLLGEYFIPGNYYAVPSGGGPLRTRRDPAFFLRTQLVCAF